MPGSVICRICLDAAVFPSGPFRIQSETEEMFRYCFPSLNLRASKDPVICLRCYRDLLICYKFKRKCSDTEEKILCYLRRPQKSSRYVDLNILKTISHTESRNNSSRNQQSTAIISVPENEPSRFMAGNIFTDVGDNDEVIIIKDEVYSVLDDNLEHLHTETCIKDEVDDDVLVLNEVESGQNGLSSLSNKGAYEKTPSKQTANHADQGLSPSSSGIQTRSRVTNKSPESVSKSKGNKDLLKKMQQAVHDLLSEPEQQQGLTDPKLFQSNTVISGSAKLSEVEKKYQFREIVMHNIGDFKTVTEDPLILEYISFFSEKHKGNNLVATYVSQQCRRLGNLIESLRKSHPIRTLQDIIDERIFTSVMSEVDNIFSSCGNHNDLPASRTRVALKDCAGILTLQAMENGDNALEKKARAFLLKYVEQIGQNTTSVKVPQPPTEAKKSSCVLINSIDLAKNIVLEDPNKVRSTKEYCKFCKRHVKDANHLESCSKREVVQTNPGSSEVIDRIIPVRPTSDGENNVASTSNSSIENTNINNDGENANVEHANNCSAEHEGNSRNDQLKSFSHNDSCNSNIPNENVDVHHTSDKENHKQTSNINMTENQSKSCPHEGEVQIDHSNLNVIKEAASNCPTSEDNSAGICPTSGNGDKTAENAEDRNGVERTRGIAHDLLTNFRHLDKEIREVLVPDDLIIHYVTRLCNKYANRKSFDSRIIWLCQLLGKFLTELKNLDKDITCLEEALKPIKFETNKQVITIIAQTNKHDKNYEKIVSDILHLALKQCAQIVISQSRKNKDDVLHKMSRDYLMLEENHQRGKKDRFRFKQKSKKKQANDGSIKLFPNDKNIAPIKRKRLSEDEIPRKSRKRNDVSSDTDSDVSDDMIYVDSDSTDMDSAGSLPDNSEKPPVQVSLRGRKMIFCQICNKTVTNYFEHLSRIHAYKGVPITKELVVELHRLPGILKETENSNGISGE